MSDFESSCIPCGLQRFRRNTYFNGKLLTERDFADEQAYLVGKDRLHNAFLHGTGTVCGLAVTAHPNEECRGRYLVLEPGLALDYCGREILVTERTVIDVELLLEEQGVSLDEELSQDLFISICYEETGDEKVPLILPDCDCADNNDAWNRIREGFRIALTATRSGARPPVNPPSEARLDWLQTLVLQGQQVTALAIDDENGQIYVATVNDAGGARVMVYDANTHDLITAFETGTAVSDIAVSARGDLIYVSGQGIEGLNGIAIIRETDIRTGNPTADVIVADQDFRLHVGSDGVLFALSLQTGEILAWQESAIQEWLTAGTPGDAPSNRRRFQLGHSISGDAPAHKGANVMMASQDGRLLFVLDRDADDDNRRLRIIDVAQLFSGPASGEADDEITVSVVLPGDPVALAVSFDAKYVFVMCQQDDLARLVKLQISDNGGLFAVTPEGRGGEWAGQASDLLLAPGEKWAYALEVDADDQTSVVSLSIDAISSLNEAEPVNPTGTRELIAGIAGFQRLALTRDRLYVASHDASEVQPDRGLVAIVDVTEGDCGGLFDRIIKPCPGGDEPCVNLAHIPDYVPGMLMQDQGKGGDGDGHIDNLTYRPLVPSSNTIVEAVRCMLAQGAGQGRPGPRGPAGLQGNHGDDGQDGVNGQNGADGQDGVNGQNGADGQDGVNGQNGADGQDGQGLNENLVHITNLSWLHDQPSFDGSDFIDQLRNIGIVISFDAEITFSSVLSELLEGFNMTSEVFQLIARVRGQFDGLIDVIVPGLTCEPVKVTSLDATGRIDAVTPLPMDTPRTRAIRLRLDDDVSNLISEIQVPFFSVLLRADMIEDANRQFAVDGNHIFGAVPDRPSGNGVQGSRFESWFGIRQ